MIMHNFKICQNFPTLKISLDDTSENFSISDDVINHKLRLTDDDNRKLTENFASIIVKCIEPSLRYVQKNIESQKFIEMTISPLFCRIPHQIYCKLLINAPKKIAS